MNSARVSRNLGSVHAAGVVASARRLPVAGKIRPGIKVLTKAASALPGAAKKYAEGLKVGASFDDIAREISKIPKAPKMPLVPRNMPYFSVRQCDFSVPGAAAKLLELYGEQRPGDSEPHLYSIPVIFPSDDIDLVFREQFEAWKASELYRWSEPDPSTGRLNCMRRQQVEPDKSARRRWGGRPTEIDRSCNPNDCPIFGAGDCRHVASLYFWIPGITGAGTIELTFTSVYASLGIAEILETVQTGLGRISGLYNGKPIFWITKTPDRVTRMNWEKGKPEKADQHIIRLEASGLDMAQVLAGTGVTPALAAPESSPALAAPPPTSAAVPQPETRTPEPDPDPDPEQPETTNTPTSDPPTEDVKALRAKLAAVRDRLGWDNQTLGQWVSDSYGDSSVASDIKVLPEIVAKLTELADALDRKNAESDREAEGNQSANSRQAKAAAPKETGGTQADAETSPAQQATAVQGELVTSDDEMPF